MCHFCSKPGHLQNDCQQREQSTDDFVPKVLAFRKVPKHSVSKKCRPTSSRDIGIQTCLLDHPNTGSQNTISDTSKPEPARESPNKVLEGQISTSDSLQIDPGHKDLVIKTKVCDQIVDTIIDTGAAISVIDLAILQNLSTDQSLSSDESFDLETVIGQRLHISGSITLPLEIGNTKYNRVTVYAVKDFPFDFVLGRDFLLSHNAIIDFKTNVLKLSETVSIPFLHQESAVNIIGIAKVVPRKDIIPFPKITELHTFPENMGTIDPIDNSKEENEEDIEVEPLHIENIFLK